MSNIVPFSFEGHSVRVINDERGDPWFVAADVCSALAIQNTSDAIKRLDDDEKGIDSIDTLGGKQDLAVINESGLYVLILGSRKEEAKRFKRWVTHEVLPSIRKTGAYAAPGATPIEAPSPIKHITDAMECGLLSKSWSNLAIKAWLCLQHPGLREAMEVLSRRQVADASAAPIQLQLEIPAPAKPIVKRKPAPQPIKLTHVPFNGFDGLNFIASDIEGYVVGGIRELKRAMRDFELISETGEPTAKGRGLVSGKTPHGPRWKVGALLNYLSGRPA